MRRIFLESARTVSAILLVMVLCASAALAAEVKVGTVDADSLNLRASGSTDANILDSASDGEKVVVLEKVGDWYKVIFRQTQGYMFADYIKVSTSADFAVGMGRVNSESVNFRKGPSLDAGVITQFGKNNQIDVIGIENGWYKVKFDGNTGYVYPDYVSIAIQSAQTDQETDAAETENTDDKDALRAKVVAYAEQFLGCKYKYGTMTGKTFDCSGFTSYVYKHFGYSLNRSAAGQVSNGAKVSSRDKLKAGDLVLFRDPSINKGAASHVGIYIGSGKFIHCSSSKSGGVKYSSLDDSYYSRYYIGARRIIN